jgi:dTDP-4-dehydrorhamnose reductase
MAKSKQVLLLGADGMLGRAWEVFLQKQGVSFDAVARRRSGSAQLDITDASAVGARLAQRYSWVINCVAYTAVDAAEQHENDAFEVNCAAVDNLARAAAVVGSRVVHYSTDYVFSGTADTPYSVDAPIAPINAYGRSKAGGELALFRAGGKPLLIRTSWVYGPWGSNFVLTMKRLLREKPVLSVVNDQRGRPTSIFSLVTGTWGLMQNEASGAYHLTDGGECTWYDLTHEIQKILGTGCDIKPCSSAEFPRPAKRPAYSVLDLSRTEALLGPLPGWHGPLQHVLSMADDA